MEIEEEEEEEEEKKSALLYTRSKKSYVIKHTDKKYSHTLKCI
jgi:hypothetical protein